MKLNGKQAFDYTSDELKHLIALKQEISESIIGINELIDNEEGTSNIYKEI